MNIFAIGTALASAVTFAGVWIATAPAPSRPAPSRPPPSHLAPTAPVHYSGCNEVRALGKAPLNRTDPGYRREMDGDGDGIACEAHTDPNGGWHGWDGGHRRSRRR